MLRNQFKTTWRNLLRNRSYALINLVGLTLGLGVAIVLFWIVRFEYSFDRHHRNADRLYQLRTHDKFGEVNSHVPQGAIKALQTQFPGVEKAVNVKATGNLVSVKVGQQVFSTKGFYYAPADFARMIDVEWISGSPTQSLNAPGQVVLDEETAQRWFNGNMLSALGKVVRLDDVVDLTVTGIIRRPRPNTAFQLRMMVSRETLKSLQDEYKNDDYWSGGDSMHHGYVLLKPGASTAPIESGLRRMAATYKDESTYVSYELSPIADSHFDTVTDPFYYVVPRWMLYTLACIGLFLIVIACINFINLATVQAIQRSREIGVRKVMGSSRSQLIGQFFGETALLVMAALGLGGLLASLLVRYADQILDTHVADSVVWDAGAIGFLLGLGGVVTLLAGLYPALVLSGFEPIRVLRSRTFTPVRKVVSLRQSLVVTQFVIAQVLVICTLLGTKQVRYFYQKDLGFNKSAVVTVRMFDAGNAVTRERFRQQLAQHPDIKGVAFGLTTPSSLRNHWWTSVLHPNLPNGEATFRLQHVDTNYFNFFNIPVLAGRTLTPSDTATGINTVAANVNVVINAKAARDLGFQEPQKALGQRIQFHGFPNTIVGVVQDYHSQRLHKAIHPHVYGYQSWNFQVASIRIDPGQRVAALDHIGRYWRAMYPNHYYEPKFLDDDLKTFYDNERKLSNFLTMLSIVGILIGCLGLFGLVSFVVTQRTKEIGVRKVLGATVVSIVSLLSRDFLKLVLVAFLLATPLAWYAMNRFLQNYEYRTPIEWWVFGLAGLLAVGIALLTVSFQSVKAALMNPVKSLRSE